MNDNPHRLPRTVTPQRYRLRLEPDLTLATFTGESSASVTVHEPTDAVVMNAAELDISAATVTAEGGPSTPATIEYDPDHDRVTLRLPETLPVGPAVVETSFSGILNDKLRGFYRSTFTDDDGNQRVLATTHFESTDARRAFPCWDEPDLKAVFEVSLVVPDDLLAVSSAAAVSDTVGDDGRREVQFAPTMVMSTYLLAFVVGPLEATEPVDVDGTPLRIVHPAGKGHLVDFALEAAAFSLRHFEQYFAIPYPGDKLDLVAIPDFAAGAMENLGCVTFREALLLIDPATATRSEQQRAADVIAHELAHMWFGNLVTMRWWNGIWLKEAFATFMELHATNAWRPDWKPWAGFGLMRSAAFEVDGLESTRSIEYPVVSPADAEGMYDLLTYEKGASVVRMLEQYLGEDVFRDGVRRYLARHAYDSTETTDLWDALEESSRQPVRRIMDSWIFQGGHPLVTAARVNGVLRLGQSRFRYDGRADATRWAVPVVLRRVGTDVGDLRVLLDDEHTDVDIGSAEAVVVNANADGFYRVGYEPGLRSAIVDLPPGAVDPVERYVLIDDAWAAVEAGASSLRDYVDLAAGFDDEDDLDVWLRLIGSFGTLDHLCPDPVRPALQRWLTERLRPAFERLGADPLPEEDDRTRELRGALLRALGVLAADPASIELAEAIDDRRDSADASLVAAAIQIVAAHGDADVFADLAGRYRDAPTPQLERRYLFALTAFPGAAELDLTLRMVLDGSIRSHDGASIVARALTHRDHGRRAWDYVEEHWSELEDRFPTNSISWMLSGITALSRPADAAAVEAFLAEHPVEPGALTVAQHLERLRVSVGLRQRVTAELEDAIA